MPSRQKRRSSAAATPNELPTAPGEEVDDAEGMQISVTPLMLAVAELDHDLVVERLAAGDDPNAGLGSCTPLVLAVKQGSLTIFRSLLESGADHSSTDDRKMTLLHHAVAEHCVDITRCLIEVAPALLEKRNQAGCTPLYHAVQHGSVECVKALLEARANLESRTNTGATPLYIAADRGSDELTNILLLAGSDINASTAFDMAPLLIAAFNGHAKVLRTLIASRADVEQRGPSGGTALYCAAQEGRENVAEILLQSRAVVDAVSDSGLTPSLIASMQGHESMVRLLLKGGGSVDVRGDKGSTLAIMAAQHGHLSTLKVVVDVGGLHTLHAQRTDGMTPLKAAKAGRHKEVTKYIEDTFAAKKAADLAAWEKQLPKLIDQLSPPKQKKAKSKRKGTPDQKFIPEATCAPAVETQSALALDAEFSESEEASTEGQCSHPEIQCTGLLNDDHAAHEVAWTEVVHKGHGKTRRKVDIAEQQKTDTSDSGLQEASTMHRAEPKPIVVPSTPCSAAPSTPAGLETPMQLWPSTPDFRALDEDPGIAGWDNWSVKVFCLPPACDAKDSTSLNHQGDSLGSSFSLSCGREQNQQDVLTWVGPTFPPCNKSCPSSDFSSTSSAVSTWAPLELNDQILPWVQLG